MARGVAKRNKRRGRVIRSAVVLKSISSVSTCESHWSGAARLPLLRVRIGLQATSDVGPAECSFLVKQRNTQHEQMSSALPPATDIGLARSKALVGSSEFR